MPIIDQEGRYRAKVIGKDLCHASTGTEQIAVGFEVTGEGPQNGHHITWYGFLTDAALDRTVERLRVLGWQGVDLNELSTIGSSGDVEITVKDDPYNGKSVLKVAYIDPLGSVSSGLKNVMDDAERRKFAAEMRSKIAAINPNAAKAKPAAKAPAPKPQNRPEPPPPGDSEIPF